MSTLTKIREAAELRAKALEEATEEARKVLKPALETFMQEHPDVLAIGWVQYTPYFNDGEPCEFSVGDLHAFPKSKEDEGSVDDSFYEKPWVYCYGSGKETGFSPETWGALVDLRRTLQSCEDELEAVFGDSVKVTVTASGVDIEFYDHD